MASQSKKTDDKPDPEMEHLEKARKSGLVSPKEYNEAKEVLEKKRAGRVEKKKEAAAKDKAVEAIVGQTLRPGKKGSGKYFMKIDTSHKAVVEKASKPVTKKGAKKKPKAALKKKPVKRKVTKKKEVASRKVPQMKDVVVEAPAVAVMQAPVIETPKEVSAEPTYEPPKSGEQTTTSTDNSLEYRDIDTIAEEQETNWRLGLAVLTIFLLILLYVKFTSFGAVGNIVVVDAYLDYTSSYSQESYIVLQEISAAYDGRVLVDYHFIGSDPQSALASAAISCAEDQDGLVLYISSLFSRHPDTWSTTSELVTFAEDLGLDTALFRLCLDGDIKDIVYQREVAAAEDLGILYTPTLVVNNKKIVGDVGYDAIQAIVDDELNTLG